MIDRIYPVQTASMSNLIMVYSFALSKYLWYIYVKACVQNFRQFTVQGLNSAGEECNFFNNRESTVVVVVQWFTF